MVSEQRMRTFLIAGAVLVGVSLPANAAKAQGHNDWDIIWQREMPRPTTVTVGQLGSLGTELENRDWQMIATGRHEIYYQPSTDVRKVAELYSLIDNVYEFLAGRSPAELKTPIKVFLVPNEWGRSRCDKASNAMRTGDQGDVDFMLTSILHEETHLFNFAFLDNRMQGWWAGEFFCIYFQKRALLQAQEKDVRQEVISELPNGPRHGLGELDKAGKKVFDEAFSALYFFEEKYGREKLNRFRRACLEESRKGHAASLSDSVFAGVFDESIDRLEQEWLKFYGWSSTTDVGRTDAGDQPLNTRISYAVDKASVQNVVQAMANKAGVGYDWTKSSAQTAPLCRRWVRNFRVANQPLNQALRKVLDPVGLSYKLEGNAIVLYKK